MQSPRYIDRLTSLMVATDFSTDAEAALACGIGLAKKHNAMVSLVHVSDVVTLDGLPLHIQELISERMESLREQVAATGLAVSVMHQVGSPWQRIAAEGEQHDLVLIGARGQTPHALRVFGLGSTADRVLRNCSTPVLTLREHASAVGARRVLIPTDFSEATSKVVRQVIRLLQPVPGEEIDVTLLHAWQPLVDYEYAFAGAGVAGMLNAVDGNQEQASGMLEQLAARFESDLVRVTPLVRPGYPSKVIEEESAIANAELIALGTHGRTGLPRWMLGSVAEQVMHRVSCPVLTVRTMVSEDDANGEAVSATDTGAA